MTFEDVKGRLKKVIPDDSWTEEDFEYFKKICGAVEKQIPKKAIVHVIREGREVNTVSYTCPTCLNHIGRDNFCKHCEQALDWSETE